MVSCATTGGVHPMLLPWNRQPTASGEQETWEDLRHDIMEAFDEEVLCRAEVRWYLSMMVEMFETPALRTPAHVMAARFCFLCADLGEA